MICLARWDSQAIMAPLDIIEGQRGHFASPEPISDEQPQHRVIPSAEHGPTINAVQQLPHVLDRDRPGQMSQPVAWRGFHDQAEVAGDQPLAVQIA